MARCRPRWPAMWAAAAPLLVASSARRLRRSLDHGGADHGRFARRPDVVHPGHASRYRLDDVDALRHVDARRRCCTTSRRSIRSGLDPDDMIANWGPLAARGSRVPAGRYARWIPRVTSLPALVALPARAAAGRRRLRPRARRHRRDGRLVARGSKPPHRVQSSEPTRSAGARWVVTRAEQLGRRPSEFFLRVRARSSGTWRKSPKFPCLGLQHWSFAPASDPTAATCSRGDRPVTERSCASTPVSRGSIPVFFFQAPTVALLRQLPPLRRCRSGARDRASRASRRTPSGLTLATQGRRGLPDRAPRLGLTAVDPGRSVVIQVEDRSRTGFLAAPRRADLGSDDRRAGTRRTVDAATSFSASKGRRARPTRHGRRHGARLPRPRRSRSSSRPTCPQGFVRVRAGLTSGAANCEARVWTTSPYPRASRPPCSDAALLGRHGPHLDLPSRRRPT